MLWDTLKEEISSLKKYPSTSGLQIKCIPWQANRKLFFPRLHSPVGFCNDYLGLGPVPPEWQAYYGPPGFPGNQNQDKGDSTSWVPFALHRKAKVTYLYPQVQL